MVIVPSIEKETEAACAFLQGVIADGIRASEIGLFCRSNDELGRAAAIAKAAGLNTTSSLRQPAPEDACLMGTMHLAKGLEFRAVLVVACDEGILPLTSRIEEVADEFELDEVVASERQLLYVAATRARDRLFVSAIAPGSEFLEDFRS